MEVALIGTNGSILPITWRNETQWVGTVGLSMGANNFVIEGFKIGPFLQTTNKLSAYGVETYTVTNMITRN